MKKYIFQDQEPELRKQLLDDNASEVTMGNYTKRFSADERNQHRKRVCEIEMELADIEKEKKDFRDEIKLRENPLKEEKSKLLDEIKANGVFVRGKLYKIIDREKKEVGFYNEDCELVEQRRLTREDNQISINEAFKSAVNM